MSVKLRVMIMTEETKYTKQNAMRSVALKKKLVVVAVRVQFGWY